MSYVEDMQSWIDSSESPEIRLPDSPPLTLTRNFLWVVVFCGASLMTIPVLVAWAASLMLK
jgi:hypothetical protein